MSTPVHEITTIQDLINVITPDNVERLITDLSHVLRQVALSKEAVDTAVPGYPFQPEIKTFRWTDDHIPSSTTHVHLVGEETGRETVLTLSTPAPTSPFTPPISNEQIS